MLDPSPANAASGDTDHVGRTQLNSAAKLMTAAYPTGFGFDLAINRDDVGLVPSPCAALGVRGPAAPGMAFVVGLRVTWKQR